MGECLIMRRGGETKKVPILDPNYPEDVSLISIGDTTASTTFTVVIKEPGNPAEYTYQWYVNDTPITVATGSTFNMTDLLEPATYSVYCEVRNKAGAVYSRVATLNVVHHYTPVLDASYPSDDTVEFNRSVTSEVKIAEPGNPAEYTYQWYVNDTPITGATDVAYTFSPGAIGAYTLRCDVTNAAGTVTSRTATITASELFLYNSGNEYTAVTGGWVATTDDYENGGSKRAPTVTKNSTYMYMEPYGVSTEGWVGTLRTSNAVDLSQFNTLYFDLEAPGGWTDLYFGVSSDNSSFESCIEQGGMDDDVGFSRQTFTIDISGLDGSYYVAFCAYTASDDCMKPCIYKVYAK